MLRGDRSGVDGRAARPTVQALTALIHRRHGRKMGLLLLLAALWWPGLLLAHAAPSANSLRAATNAPGTSAAPGVLSGWGGDYYGQLGNGSNTTGSPLVTTQVISTVTAVAAGGDHSLALVNGNVYAWGANSYGQLGDNSTSPSSSPVAIGGFPAPVTAIAAGGSHSGSHGGVAAQSGEDSLALVNGTVWAWGANQDGQLGTNTTATYCTGHIPCSNVPLQVSGLPSGDPITAIAAGGDHNLALTQSGNVWAWGDNASGQLGNGSSGGFSTTPQQVSVISNVVAIAAGDAHSLALTANGAVYAWGNGSYGQLGIYGPSQPATTPVIVKFPLGVNLSAIAAGANHNLALDSNGNVWAWGQNNDGQAGNDPNSSQITTPAQVSGINGTVTAIAAGDAHSVALASNGTVWVWGADTSFEQLGAAVTTKCGSTPCSATPVLLNSASGASAIAAGANHSLVISPMPADSLPSSLSLSATYPGGSASQSFDLVNTGGVPIVISSVTVGPTIYGFSGNSTCNGASLAPGASCSVSVSFAPPYYGSFVGSVTINDSVPGNQNVTLNGTGVAAPTNTPINTNTPTPGASPIATRTVTPTPSLTPTVSATAAPVFPTPTAAVSSTVPGGGGGAPGGTTSGGGGTSGGSPGGGGQATATPQPSTGSGYTPKGGSGHPHTNQHHPKKKGRSSRPKIVCKATQSKAYPLILHLLSRDISGPGIYVVGVHTGSCAQVSMTLQVSTTQVKVTGKGKHRKRVSHTVVLYKAATHGGADSHGQYTGVLSVHYKPANPVPAILTVSTRFGKKSKSYQAHVTIQPSHPPILTASVRPGSVLAGGNLTISVHTAPNAQVTALLFITGNKTTVTGTGKNRKTITGQVVVYHTNLQGYADARGVYKGLLRVGYKPTAPAQGTLIVSAAESYGAASRTLHVTIMPARK